MQMNASRLTALAVVLAIVNPTFTAVRGEHAEYIGGTIKTAKQGSQGILSLDDKKALVFECGKNCGIRVPYSDIRSMEFGQKVGRRIGSTIAVGVTTIGVMALPMLLSKKKNHFLTILFVNSAGENEVVVLELAKGIVRTTIPVLEARTGQHVELQDSEVGPVRATAKTSPASERSSTGSADRIMAAEAPPAPKALTNDDVVALKAAGLSDDLVVAKIKGSAAGYSLDTGDLIALKQADVSEPVIQAMMSAASAASAPTTPAPQAAAPAAERSKPGLLARVKGTFSSPSDANAPKPAPQSQPARPAMTPSPLCSVTVVSQPAGARIFVDGYAAGVAPSVVKLQAGTYKLTLKADGYPEYSQQIVVEPGQVRSFGVAMDGSK
jgi:hypothetical protein